MNEARNPPMTFKIGAASGLILGLVIGIVFGLWVGVGMIAQGVWDEGYEAGLRALEGGEG